MFTELVGIFMVIMIIGGVFSAVVGLMLLIGTIRFLRVAESTEGIVIGHEAKVSESPGQDGFKTTFVYPVVKFMDTSGKQHVVTLLTGTAGYQPYPVGKRVTILYPPEDTKRARIRGFLHLWSFPVMFTMLGVVSIIFAWGFRTLTSL